MVFLFPILLLAAAGVLLGFPPGGAAGAGAKVSLFCEIPGEASVGVVQEVWLRFDGDDGHGDAAYRESLMCREGGHLRKTSSLPFTSRLGIFNDVLRGYAAFPDRPVLVRFAENGDGCFKQVMTERELLTGDVRYQQVKSSTLDPSTMQYSRCTTS